VTELSTEHSLCRETAAESLVLPIIWTFRSKLFHFITNGCISMAYKNSFYWPTLHIKHLKNDKCQHTLCCGCFFGTSDLTIGSPNSSVNCRDSAISGATIAVALLVDCGSTMQTFFPFTTPDPDWSTVAGAAVLLWLWLVQAWTAGTDDVW